MKNIINSAKLEYKEIDKVICPYLEKEVCFTSAGFKHLIWKSEMGMRPTSEIKERLEAIKYIKIIIEKSGTLQEIEKLEDKIFYAFIAIVKEKKYKVVVSTTKDGRIIFNSIIPKWITGKRDKLNTNETKNPSVRTDIL